MLFPTDNFSSPGYADLLHLFFDTLRDHLWSSFLHESISFDGIKPKNIMIFATFNPWKLVNDIFLFPHYLHLLSLFFDAFRDRLWLVFWHKSIAFDGSQPKKIMIFAIFNPWKFANNNFSFPDYADLLHLLFAFGTKALPLMVLSQKRSWFLLFSILGN